MPTSSYDTAEKSKLTTTADARPFNLPPVRATCTDTFALRLSVEILFVPIQVNEGSTIILWEPKMTIKASHSINTFVCSINTFITVARYQ